MDQGGLVPDNVIIGMVIEEIKGLKGNPHLLLDGFPRTQPQAESLGKAIKIDVALNLAVPNDEIVSRISGRWTHLASGRVYAYDYNPPKVTGKDDVTGEPLIQRDDDKPESVRKRLGAYDKMTAPLIEYYSKQGSHIALNDANEYAYLHVCMRACICLYVCNSKLCLVIRNICVYLSIFATHKHVSAYGTKSSLVSIFVYQ
jgi:adenylate kinase family enzyme